MLETDTVAVDERFLTLEETLDGRIARLRDMYWQGTYRDAVVRVAVPGSGQDALVGYARDFAALLAASDPFIQPGELIVGTHLAMPEDPDALDLGYYNPHYPPGYPILLELGFSGIRDRARAKRDWEAADRLREQLRSRGVALQDRKLG